MGLSIHYQLKFQSEHADIEDLQARWLVEEARKRGGIRRGWARWRRSGCWPATILFPN